MKKTFEKLGKIIYDDNNMIIAIESEQSNGFGDGYIFKDMEAFHNKKGICYMSEQDIIDFDNDINGPITEQELINNGFAIDYNTAIDLTTEYLRYYDLPTNTFICEYIAQYILENAEWASFGTYLHEKYECIEEWINEIIKEKIKIGAKCKWNDPSIDDYPIEDRKDVENTIYTIALINNEENNIYESIDDIFLLVSECGGEVECTINEIEII